MNLNKKRIGVIGAGPSGLVSGKTCLEYGFDVKIFDKNNSLGGVWSKEGKAWENMVTHISYVSMGYSDFQWNVSNENKPFYPTREQMYDYLYDYSKHFNILDKINLNTNVSKISQLENKKWLIKYNNNNQLEDIEETFDYLIISTGMFSKKREIDIKKNLKNFKGKIHSSEDYKNSNYFKDKNVLTIGSFASGIEIAADIANVSKQVYLCCKRNNWVIKRGFPFEKNIVFDYCLQNRQMIYNDQISKEEHNIFLYNLFNKISNQKENKYFPFTGQNYYEQHIMISDNFLDLLENGRIKVTDKKIIKTIENNVYLNDEYGEEIFKVDDIILCDGYDLDYSFFDQNIQDQLFLDLKSSNLPVLLYNNVFSPNLENIGFVGSCKISGIIEMEMMARYIVHHFAGFIQLPDKETMFNCIKNEQFECRRLNQYFNKPQFPINSVKYCDQMAKEIGALPNLNQMKENEPLLYEINQNKMFHPAFYRLVGPFSNFNESKNLIISDYNHYFFKK